MSLEYCVFRTEWGFMGLAGRQGRASSLALPLPFPDQPYQILTQINKEKLVENRTLLPLLTEQLKAYFAGSRIDKWNCELDLAYLPKFTRQVLLATCQIPYGSVKTYGELAQNIGCPQGARAVGQALKRNPLPIIIPCHRVLAVGSWGGFTATGGLEAKKALLRWEGYKHQPK